MFEIQSSKSTIMKSNLLKILFLCFCSWSVIAQDPSNVLTESSEPDTNKYIPLDDVVERKIISEKNVLAYDNPREADMYWSKRVWRVIDTREKINLVFRYEEGRFFDAMINGIKEGVITSYSTVDDKFTSPLKAEDALNKLSKTDTIRTFDPETYEETYKVVKNDINPDDIKKFRIKEIWFFDKEASMVNCRILGIAPIQDVKDENGNFKYQEPLFWIYYPDARKYFARFNVFVEGNDAAQTTWEDWMEMRKFNSYIFKESNVYNRRIQDYVTGVDMLMEGDKIKEELFNYEHDLWSY